MAVEAAPQNQNARSMLALVYAAQQVAHAGAPAEFRDSEAGKAEGARMAMAEASVRASGPPILLGALALALKYDDAPVAVHLMRALPAYGNVHLGEGSAVAAALQAKDQRIQWFAALTCIRLDPKSAFPRSDQVVRLASDAVALGSIRQVLVVCDDTKVAVQLQTELNASGLHAVVARTGAEGLVRTKQSPFDAVVVAGGLKDMMAQHVVNDIRRDYRTKTMPVLLLVPESQAQAAKDLMGDSVSGVITTPLAANVYVPVVRDSASKSPLDDRARALALSEEACEVLAAASPSPIFDFKAAQGALAATLTDPSGKPDSLRLKALGALRKWGGDASLPALIGTIGNSANSEAVRAESARVAGIILTGKAPTQKGFETLLGGLSDASVEVRTACAGALGGARLNDVQRKEVADKTKP
jgi:CheY-like chemotaxis protein